MPKVKETQKELNARICTLYPNKFRVDDRVLYCICCNVKVTSNKVFNVTQHLNTATHKEKERKRIATGTNSVQTLVSEHQERPNSFPMELCTAFVEANIPLKKVNHPSIKKFLERNTKCSTPSERTLRQSYVPSIYQKTMERLREKATNAYIWTSIDETTDAKGRLVVNFIFGVLTSDDHSEERKKSYLFNSAVVEASNANTMATFFNDSLHLLWPNGIKYDRVLFLVTDAAPYMQKAGKCLQTMYSKLIHVNCFAHGLHRLAEFVRVSFPLVNGLISNVKSVFIKSPSRCNKFKQMFPDIPLPPRPVITRWGTWLEAADYYSKYFDAVKAVINELCSEDAESIRAAKELFRNDHLESQLVYIKCHFLCLCTAIIKLKTAGLELKESLHLYKNIKTSLQGAAEKKYLEKFDLILKRNKGYPLLCKIEETINAGIPSEDDFIEQYSIEELSLFKHCPVSSADVERSFSKLSLILTDKRHNFTFENLKQHLIINYNLVEQ